MYPFPVIIFLEDLHILVPLHRMIIFILFAGLGWLKMSQKNVRKHKRPQSDEEEQTSKKRKIQLETSAINSQIAKVKMYLIKTYPLKFSHFV